MRKMRYVAAALVACFMVSGTAEARGKGKRASAAIAHTHAELRADRDCAVVRTIGEIAWVFTPVVPIFTTPCNLREVDRAERALRAFEQKHRLRIRE